MAQDLWQTGAASEHSLQRRVHTYRDYIDVERLRQRITELNGAGKMDKEIAAILNQEGFVAARGCAFKGENVWLLRTRWGIPTVRSTASARIPCGGPTAASQSKAWSRNSELRRKPYSIISRVACSPDAS